MKIKAASEDFSSFCDSTFHLVVKICFCGDLGKAIRSAHTGNLAYSHPQHSACF